MRVQVHRACEVQMVTQGTGRPSAIAQPVQERCARDSLYLDPRFSAGRDTFDALQRLVDRSDPSHRS